MAKNNYPTVESLSNYDLSLDMKIFFFFHKKEFAIINYESKNIEIDLSQDDSYLYLLHGRNFPNVIVDEVSWKQLANP